MIFSLTSIFVQIFQYLSLCKKMHVILVLSKYYTFLRLNNCMVGLYTTWWMRNQMIDMRLESDGGRKWVTFFHNMELRKFIARFRSQPLNSNCTFNIFQSWQYEIWFIYMYRILIVHIHFLQSCKIIVKSVWSI